MRGLMVARVNTNPSNTEYDAGNRRLDAGYPRLVERAEKAARSARLQRDQALRWLMADRRGRAIVWSLLGRAGVFRSSMAPSSELTAFNEGGRDLGLWLLADIMRLCPANYALMQSEAQTKPPTPGEKDDERDDNDA